MLHRWSFRLPIWVAVAIVALVYVVRSAVRGFDFRPDLPGDAVVLVMFLLMIAVVAYVRRADGDDSGDDGSDADRPTDGGSADV